MNHPFEMRKGDTKRTCVGQYSGSDGGREPIDVEADVVNVVDMARDWRDGPDMILGVLRCASDE